MDERTKTLVAIGASAAVNCHPCITHHLAECDRMAISRDEARAAMEVGMTVNRGAASQTGTHVRAVLGQTATGQEKSGGCGCGC